MSVSNQMMKGLLDGAILGLIAKVKRLRNFRKLKENQFPEISDGVFIQFYYVKQKGYVHTTRKSDNGGPQNIIQFLTVV